MDEVAINVYEGSPVRLHKLSSNIGSSAAFQDFNVCTHDVHLKQEVSEFVQKHVLIGLAGLHCGCTTLLVLKSDHMEP